MVAAATAVAMTWLIWVALLHSRPPAAAQVSSFNIVSDTSMEVEVIVQRRDPGQVAVCRLLAQSTDFQPVAEIELTAPPDHSRLTQVKTTLTTLRRATSVKVTSCRIAVN